MKRSPVLGSDAPPQNKDAIYRPPPCVGSVPSAFTGGQETRELWDRESLKCVT